MYSINLPANLPSRRQRAFVSFALLLLVLSLLECLTATTVYAARSARGPWKQVDRSDGITISVRAVAGQNLPEFRGVAVINANLFELLGVVMDVKRHCQWRSHCHTTKILTQHHDLEQTMYTRIDAPWPVSDRDVVLHARTTFDTTRRVALVRFSSVRHRRAPVVDGVVRMPRLSGHYRIEEISPKRVRIIYQVFSDPGGMIPDWLARRSAKVLPHKAIMGMKRQVKKMRHLYTWIQTRYDPRKGGVIPVKYLAAKR